MELDTSRHSDLFKPFEFDKRTDVIGAGATGSRVAMSLAKLGVRKLHVWDDDKVEAHNISNQIYSVKSVGHEKVYALESAWFNGPPHKTHLAPDTDSPFKPHFEKVTKDNANQLGAVVFLLTDTMSSRKEIISNLPSWTELLIETRMGTSEGRIYTIDCNSKTQKEQHGLTLFNDDDIGVELSACGTPISIGPTADVLAGFAVWQFLRWLNFPDEGMENEIVYHLRPSLVMARSF
jgi:molybdopterin/thiamine biosynthesis adenylyltransferase